MDPARSEKTRRRPQRRAWETLDDEMPRASEPTVAVEVEAEAEAEAEPAFSCKWPRGGLTASDVVREVVPALLTGLLSIIVNVGAAGIVFHEGTPLGAHAADAITLALLCTTAGSAAYALTSGCPALVQTDAFMGTFFLSMATRITDNPAGPERPFGTVAVAMAMVSAMTGLAYLLMGAAKVGRLVQYVPTPVISGYLASIGYLLLNGTAQMVTGCSTVDAACLASNASSPQLPIAHLLGLFLFTVERKASPLARTLVAPVLLLVSTGAYQAARYALDEDLALWRLHVSEGATLWTLPDALDLANVSWGVAFFEALQTSCVCFVPAAIKTLLVYTAYQKRFPTAEVDYNRELRATGAMQILSCWTTQTPSVTLSGTYIAANLGATSRLCELVLGCGSLLLACFGCSTVMSVTPLALFAALLCSSAYGLLLNNLLQVPSPRRGRGPPRARCAAATMPAMPPRPCAPRHCLPNPSQAWHDLPRADFCLVVLHVVFTVVFGITAAVALGFLLTAILFILEYTKHSPMQVSTAQLERSSFVRTAAEEAVLDAEGGAVFIAHLHAHLFFGSVNWVHDELRVHLRQLRRLSKPLVGVLIDFDRCTAIDATAVTVLLQTKRVARSARLVFASMSAEMLTLLDKTSSAGEFEHYTSVDFALEQLEGELLKRSGVRGSDHLSGAVAAQAPAVAPSAAEGAPAPRRSHGGDGAAAAEGGGDDGRGGGGGGGSAQLREAAGSLRLGGGEGERVASEADATPPGGGGAARTSDSDGAGASTAPRLLVLGAAGAEAQMPRELHEMRSALRGVLSAAHGSGGRADGLLAAMELVVVPPGGRMYDTWDRSEPRSLYFLGEGTISISHDISLPERAAGGGGAARVQRSRIAKYGPGSFFLGVFMSPEDEDEQMGSHFLGVRGYGGSAPAGPVAPRKVATADTRVLCLRLTKEAMGRLEGTHPAEAMALYRLLLQISMSRLHDREMDLLATTTFKSNVRPSASLQRLLAVTGGSKEGGAGAPGTATGEGEPGCVAVAASASSPGPASFGGACISPDLAGRPTALLGGFRSYFLEAGSSVELMADGTPTSSRKSGGKTPSSKSPGSRSPGSKSPGSKSPGKSPTASRRPIPQSKSWDWLASSRG